jgi:hypothetical protein
MERIFSYILVAIASLLFIAHSNEIKSDDIVPGVLYHAANSSNREDGSQIKSSSSDDVTSFIFCRYGKSAQSFHLLKEKQYFSTGSFAKPYLAAFIKVNSAITFGSFNTHIPDRLKDLLYPKHSFW